MFNSNQCWDGGSFVQSLENCYYKMKSWEEKAVHAVTTHIISNKNNSQVHVEHKNKADYSH